MAFFIQNLEIQKINTFAVALKFNLNCVYACVCVCIYIYLICIQFHINRVQTDEADKICFILCILSLYLLPLVLAVPSVCSSTQIVVTLNCPCWFENKCPFPQYHSDLKARSNRE